MAAFYNQTLTLDSRRCRVPLCLFTFMHFVPHKGSRCFCGSSNNIKHVVTMRAPQMSSSPQFFVIVVPFLLGFVKVCVCECLNAAVNAASDPRSWSQLCVLIWTRIISSQTDRDSLLRCCCRTIVSVKLLSASCHLPDLEISDIHLVQQHTCTYLAVVTWRIKWLPLKPR